jgi:tripartite-type tricarboxylate transporter receptor subunit TctC
MNKWWSALLAVAILGLLASVSVAQQWPNRPIRAYAGWSAGGSSDIVARAIAREMEDHLGQNVTVTNVDGALGSIAGRQVATAPADGNLWFGGAMVSGTWPTLGQADISWENFYSFIAVVFPTTIYVLNDAPWQTVEDLIADIEASEPGSFRFGHPGRGSNGEIFAGVLLEEAGVGGRAQSIPYGGGREAGRFLLSGDIEFVSVTMGDLSDWAVAGQIRPLANLYEEEIEFEGVLFPAVTDVYPGLAPMQAINPYFGISVRRDTPEEIVTRMAEAFVHTVQQERFQQVAVQERAGILAPAMGQASDEIMARIESARGWALYDLEVAPNDPAELNIPTLDEWSWPPHERAEQARPWPEVVEELNAELQ